jgi:hypothetical protein
MIMFTLIMAPVAYNNQAYAEEPTTNTQHDANAHVANTELNCDEDGKTKNEDGLYVYRPGCGSFDDSKTQITEMNTGMDQITMIMLIVFGLVIISSLKFSKTDEAKVACKQNKAAQFSIRAAQLAMAGFIAGELIMNNKLKKSLEAGLNASYETTATSKKTRDNYYEQMKAFGVLRDLYDEDSDEWHEDYKEMKWGDLEPDYKDDGGVLKNLENKQKILTAAEIAMLASEGVELAYYIGCKVKCAIPNLKATAAIPAYLTALTTGATTKLAMKATDCTNYCTNPTAVACYPACIGPCGAAVGAVAGAVGGVSGIYVTLLGLGGAELADRTSSAVTDYDTAKDILFYHELANHANSSKAISNKGKEQISDLSKETSSKLQEVDGGLTQNKDSEKQLTQTEQSTDEAYETTAMTAAETLKTVAQTVDTACILTSTSTIDEGLQQVAKEGAEAVINEALKKVGDEVANEVVNNLASSNVDASNLGSLQEVDVEGMDEAKSLQDTDIEGLSSVNYSTGVAAYADKVIENLELDTPCCGNNSTVAPAWQVPHPIVLGAHGMTEDITYEWQPIQKVVEKISKLTDGFNEKKSNLLDKGNSLLNPSGSIYKQDNQIIPFGEQLYGPAYPEMDKKDTLMQLFDGLMTQLAFAKTAQSLHADPKMELAELKYNVEHKAEIFVDALQNIDPSKFDKTLAKIKFKNEDERIFTKQVLNLTHGILIKEAKAGTLDDVMKVVQWVGIAGMFLKIAPVVERVYQESIGNKPLYRVLLFGVLSAMGYYIHNQNKKKIENVENYVESIKTEEKKFFDAIFEKGKVTRDRSTTPTIERERTGERENFTGVKGCLSRSGTSYVPATCPITMSKSKNANMRISREAQKFTLQPHLDTLSMLPSLSAGITSSQGLSDPSFIDGKLAEVGSNGRAAMRKHNKKLRSHIDKMNKKNMNNMKKLFKGKSVKIPSLSKAYNEAQGNIGKMAGIAAPISNNSSDIPAKGSKVSTFNPKSFSMPKLPGAGGGDGGFDLDFDDDEEGGVEEVGEATSEKGEQNLADFELKQNDIVKKPEVSIFKVLSNRYILSYPKILEEELEEKK